HTFPAADQVKAAAGSGERTAAESAQGVPLLDCGVIHSAAIGIGRVQTGSRTPSVGGLLSYEKMKRRQAIQSMAGASAAAALNLPLRSQEPKLEIAVAEA